MQECGVGKNCSYRRPKGETPSSPGVTVREKCPSFPTMSFLKLLCSKKLKETSGILMCFCLLETTLGAMPCSAWFRGVGQVSLISLSILV